jgi:hypothetical protein
MTAAADAVIDLDELASNERQAAIETGAAAAVRA